MASQLHHEIQGSASPASLSDVVVSSAPRTIARSSKKKLIRRTDRDYSQALRRWYQFVSPGECLVGQPVLPVGAALRDSRTVCVRAAARGSRGLAAHRRHDEPEISPRHRSRDRTASGRDDSADYVSVM